MLSIKPKIKRIAIYTLGCKANQADSIEIEEKLKNYVEIVSPKEKADIYIVNTCTVTKNADVKSRHYARLLKKRNPKAKIIWTGCYAEQDSLKEVADYCFKNREKIKISEFLKKEYKLEKKKTINIIKNRTRAFLKIQDGCDNYCSYCIVPYVRGKSKSKPINLILKELNNLQEQNYKEIVLTGIHIGKYGKDLKSRESLYKLLKKIIPVLHSSTRIRLSSIEINEIDDKLIDFISENNNICRHLHMPLQSGDTHILKAMNRNYSTDYFKKKISKIKKKIDDISIGTDVIVGFPGEDTNSFGKTYKFLEKLPISYGHIFQYSDRPYACASKFSDKVDNEEKAKRSKILRELVNKKKKLFYKNVIGKEVDILVEAKKDTGGYLKGFTSNYIPVFINYNKKLINQFCQVKLIKLYQNKLIGKISKVYG